MTRLFAAALMLLTLNVSAAGAIRACAQETRQAPAGHQGCEKPEHPAPKPGKCCDAMTACTLSFAIEGAADEARVTPDAEGIVSRDRVEPSRPPRSPEPPPPKERA